jgi:hypothetical protein
LTTGTPVHALDIQFKVLQEVSRRLEERRSRQMPQRIRLRV